jgi:tRNA 2-thiocytidine biosynthesis protein TtcA
MEATPMKKVLSMIRRADQDFSMIKAGDRVMVGVSGGKDSLLLLTALARYRKFSDYPFELCGGMIDLGFGGFEQDTLLAYAKSIDVELYIKPTNIGHVIFDTRKENNPCSLCAKMRRGSLNELAKRCDCNKIALGHHRDDLVETLLMSMLYESRIRTFAPVTWMDRTDMVQIRPMIYLEESHIIEAGKQLELPVAHNACPACGHTKRQEMKELIQHLKTLCPDADVHLSRAIQHTENYDLWDKVKVRPDDYELAGDETLQGK